MGRLSHRHLPDITDVRWQLVGQGRWEKGSPWKGSSPFNEVFALGEVTGGTVAARLRQIRKVGRRICYDL